uniref:Keratin n=1 Tax=Gallus gallus TaxID=9031 RepID=A0A8V0ZFT8_CHICK
MLRHQEHRRQSWCNKHPVSPSFPDSLSNSACRRAVTAADCGSNTICGCFEDTEPEREAGGQQRALVKELRKAKKDRLTLGSVFPPCSVFQLCLPQREMSCCRPCVPSPCGASGPTPLASSCSEPCVARCADSTVVIEASPVVVTLPGPILTSFPQSTAVGSSLSAAVGSSLSTAGVPISSGGSLGLGGSGLCLPRPRCSFNC